MNNIQNLLNNFIIDPQNPENNYNLAIYYENIGQTASALSYYYVAKKITTQELS